VPAEPSTSIQVSQPPPHQGGRQARRGGPGNGRTLVVRSAIITTVLALAAVVFGVLVVIPASGKASKVAMPSAAPGQSPAVGALFSMSDGHLQTHFCSASVVDSPSGDLVLTAAHCVTNSSSSPLAFVPDYSNGKAPYGIWVVSRVIVDQNWQSSSDPDDDFAFLVVHRQGSQTPVQDLTGAEAIGFNEPAGQKVLVAGYPGDLNTQISCVNTVISFSPTQLQFDCGGYTDGTSGGPFLADVVAPGTPGIVMGVIGGYQQGGDTPSVSYAARFGPSMEDLYKTAIAEAGP
jgi:V8-like Glu-specific endopeptidase